MRWDGEGKRKKGTRREKGGRGSGGENMEERGSEGMGGWVSGPGNVGMRE